MCHRSHAYAQEIQYTALVRTCGFLFPFFFFYSKNILYIRRLIDNTCHPGLYNNNNNNNKLLIGR